MRLRNVELKCCRDPDSPAFRSINSTLLRTQHKSIYVMRNISGRIAPRSVLLLSWWLRIWLRPSVIWLSRHCPPIIPFDLKPDRG
jgi:hypothetical protein